MPNDFMTIIPKIVLDQNDFKPFIEQFKKKLGDTKSDFIITSIVPLCISRGEWTVEISAEPLQADVKT